jgi:hypothetical protein
MKLLKLVKGTLSLDGSSLYSRHYSHPPMDTCFLAPTGVTLGTVSRDETTNAADGVWVIDRISPKKSFQWPII